MTPQLTVISLGWGVQSWTLAAMSALGELPPVDYAIHADTTHEASATYTFAAEQTAWLKANGVQVVTVRESQQVTTFDYRLNIPAFTLSQADGVKGQLRRQCTHRWKIIPMRRFIAAELKRRHLSKRPGIVEQWLGISTDEWQRMKHSDVKYITHRYPLVEKKMSRADCLNWLQTNNLPTPPKSACTFCPYHSRPMWEEMKRENGADWQHAVAVDAKIRNARPPYPLFIHRARVPLAEAVQLPEDHGAIQTSFFDLDDAPCDSGHCFL